MRGELLRRHVIQTAAETFVIVFVAPGGAASPAIQASAARGLSGWAATEGPPLLRPRYARKISATGWRNVLGMPGESSFFSRSLTTNS